MDQQLPRIERHGEVLPQALYAQKWAGTLIHGHRTLPGIKGTVTTSARGFRRKRGTDGKTMAKVLELYLAFQVIPKSGGRQWGKE